MKGNKFIKNNIFDVIIIGAGPAGLFTGLNIARAQIPSTKSVLIIEKNSFAGKKLLLTGGGKCNLTNAADISDFFNHYNKNSRKFLKKALYNFDNNDLLDFFKNFGVEFKADDKGRVIPENADAEKIRNILVKRCKENSVKINYNEKVIKIEKVKDCFKIITCKNYYYSRRLVLAAGGCSYPQTGSSGDGYKFAEEMGHSVSHLKPALTGILIKDFPFGKLAGISIKNCRVFILRRLKTIFKLYGEVLFSHKGISGSDIINITRDVNSGDTILLSFTGKISELKLKQLFHDNQKNAVKTFLKNLELPERLILILCRMAGIDPGLFIYQLPQNAKINLINLLTKFKMTAAAAFDFKNAMATSGGVHLNELNPASMESLIVPNLYFAGEIVDIDGESGGYNLQAAFSTAKLAAKGAGLKVPVSDIGHF